MAHYSEDEFWALLDLSESIPFTASAKVRLDAAVSLASPMLSETQISLLHMALDMHYFNPRIEMDQQRALDVISALMEGQQVKVEACEAFVVAGASFACDVQALEELISNAGDIT